MPNHSSVQNGESISQMMKTRSYISCERSEGVKYVHQQKIFGHISFAWPIIPSSLLLSP